MSTQFLVQPFVWRNWPVPAVLSGWVHVAADRLLVAIPIGAVVWLATRSRRRGPGARIALIGAAVVVGAVLGEVLRLTLDPFADRPDGPAIAGRIVNWILVSAAGAGIVWFWRRQADFATVAAEAGAADARTRRMLFATELEGWRRSVRSARALAHVRQAQDESAALLQLSRVESYRRALQPQTILQSVDALRRLYRSDPAEADALLDTLVGFLRGAVRSLNAERCAFPEELDLAWRYLQLRQRTVGGVGVLSVERSPAAPDIPFPPRLLMPILEAVCLAGCRIDLRAGWRAGAYGLDLAAEGAGAASAVASLRRRIDLLDGEPDLSSRLVATPTAVLWSVRVRRPAAHRARVSVPSSNSGVSS